MEGFLAIVYYEGDMIPTSERILFEIGGKGLVKMLKTRHNGTQKWKEIKGGMRGYGSRERGGCSVYACVRKGRGRSVGKLKGG